MSVRASCVLVFSLDTPDTRHTVDTVDTVDRWCLSVAETDWTNLL